MKPTHGERREARERIALYLKRHTVEEAAGFFHVHPQFVYGVIREFRLTRKKGYDSAKR